MQRALFIGILTLLIADASGLSSPLVPETCAAGGANASIVQRDDRLAASPSTTRGSQLSRTAARWMRNTTGVPGLFVPSSRYANATPPVVIVCVGTFAN